MRPAPSGLALLLALVSVPLLGQAPTPAERRSEVNGWKLDLPHRFVWIQDRTKVGESVLFFSREPGATGSLKVESFRTFEARGVRQRSHGITLCQANGAAQSYEDTLEVQTEVGKSAGQVTRVKVKGDVAEVRFTQAGVESAPREIPWEPRLHLVASNALEHWVLLLWPFQGKEEVKKLDGQTLDLFYPELGQTFRATFRKAGEESIKTATGERKAQRFNFEAPGGLLKGSLWLDPEGHLIQLEFPNATTPALTLRVALAEEPPQPTPAAQK